MWYAQAQLIHESSREVANYISQHLFLVNQTQDWPLKSVAVMNIGSFLQPCLCFYSTLTGETTKFFSMYMNQKLMILNRHITQCNWPCTLEWGCFVGSCILIHCSTKFLFRYPKLIPKNHLHIYTLLYQKLHCQHAYLYNKIYICINPSVTFFCWIHPAASVSVSPSIEQAAGKFL